LRERGAVPAVAWDPSGVVLWRGLGAMRMEVGRIELPSACAPQIRIYTWRDRRGCACERRGPAWRGTRRLGRKGHGRPGTRRTRAYTVPTRTVITFPSPNLCSKWTGHFLFSRQQRSSIRRQCECFASFSASSMYFLMLFILSSVAFTARTYEARCKRRTTLLPHCPSLSQ
jgi:hypothetical protein